jgi:hypothetical protein
MTNLAAVALQDANRDLLRSLTVNSEVLNNIHDQFKDLLFSKYEIDIHSFQESRGMSGVKGVSGKVSFPKMAALVIFNATGCGRLFIET